MKKTSLIFRLLKNSVWPLTIVILILVLNSCVKDDEEEPDGGDTPTTTSIKFMASYNPNSQNLLGEDYLTALLQINNGELSYSQLTAYYPKSNDLWRYADMGSGDFAMGLHDDFNESNGVTDWSAQGLYYNIDNGSNDILPLVAASEESDYSYFSSGTVKMSENGYVFYISATNDIYYGDQYKGYLVRYNSADKSHKVAVNPDAFVLSQPEQGSDTETSLFTSLFFVSRDGRYVYGRLEAYGVDGGSLHWDYRIIFRYDFETDTYTRMGAAGDSQSSFLGITSDDSYLYYWDGSYKVQNLTTMEVSEFTDGSTGTHYPIQWNQQGFCMGATTGIYYYNILTGTNYKVVDEYGVDNSQFDASGEHIIFTLEGSETNYLCRTESYNENASWDTLASIPYAFPDIVLIK